MPVSFYTRWILRQLFGVDFSVEAVLLNELVCEVHTLLRTQAEEAETLGPALPLSTLWTLQGNSQCVRMVERTGATDSGLHFRPG